MRTAWFFSAFALALLACQPGDQGQKELAPPLGHTRQAIIGGTASPASQDSTVLIAEGGYPICTGVLIAPNLVLTARHCVSDYNERSECGGPLGATAPATSLTISAGPYASPLDQQARGARLFLAEPDQLCSADIALLSLDNDIKGVTPSKVRFSPLKVGDITTAVGYGDNGGGREQRADVNVLAIGPSSSTYRTEEGYAIPMNIPIDEITTTESTCYGDSGGPLFDAANQVVAVASRGLDESCRDRPTVWTTFGGHAKLIKDAAAAAGHPIVETTSTDPGSRSPSVNGSTPAATRDDEPETLPDGKPNPKKKPKTTATPSGCVTAPGRTSSSSSALAVLALLGLTLVRRRR